MKLFKIPVTIVLLSSILSYTNEDANGSQPGAFTQVGDNRRNEAEAQLLESQQKLLGLHQKKLETQVKLLQKEQEHLNHLSKRLEHVGILTNALDAGIGAGFGFTGYLGLQSLALLNSSRALGGLKPLHPLFRTPFYGISLYGGYIAGKGLVGLSKYYTSNIRDYYFNKK